jgi:hypothetical protein
VYVISLSTIPPRFGHIRPALEALLAQNTRAESVRLYIPQRYRRFPDWDGTLPEVPRGIEIMRPEEDLGPATKVLFAADELRGQDLHLLYCDDDRVYLPGWSERFLKAARERPGHAVALAGFDLHRMGLDWRFERPAPRARRMRHGFDIGYRWRRTMLKIARALGRDTPPLSATTRRIFFRSGYIDIAEGLGGVLVRPDWFGRDAWDIPPIMWAVDDIWLSGQLARQGIPIWAPAGAVRFRTTDLHTRVEPLFRSVIEGATRRQANQACARYMRDTFGVWGGAPSSRGT